MDGIDGNNLQYKPGWVRVSLHPTMNADEVRYITGALREIVHHGEEWGREYRYNPRNNEYEYLYKNPMDLGRDPFFEG